MPGVGETENFFSMEIREELRDAYKMAKELAADLMGKVSSRIVTVYDEENNPWAEFRVEFVDGVPTNIKVQIGGTKATKEWKDDEQGLESMENILCEIQNFIIVSFNWLGE